MRRWIIAALASLCIVLAIAPGTAFASQGGWTYDATNQTLTSDDGTIVLNNVTADGTLLTIGDNSGRDFVSLDLSGLVTDESGASYTISYVDGWALYGCTSLASVKLPEGVCSIGFSALDSCTSLASVDLPDSLYAIGGQAFYGCTSLASIELPEGLESLGWSAFCDCSSLESIVIPEGIEEIDVQTFYGCTSLSSVKLPDSLAAIRDSAFYNCSSLTSIDLPDGIASIGFSAFCSCSSLESVTLPDELVSLGSYAFCECTSLASVEFPSGFESMGDGTFDYCSSLASIVLPESVTSIGGWAFEHCPSLESVTVLATEPPATAEDIFAACPDSLSILVPGESVEAYRTADGWSAYAEQIEGLFLVTVANGSGSGRYAEGDLVTITANTAASDEHFASWSSDTTGLTFADEHAESTTFVMPGESVTVLAAFEPHSYEGGRCSVCGAVDPDFSPAIIKGADGVWRKGSTTGLAFASDAAFADFLGVLVDGTELDASCYEISEGSTEIVLKASYLETLSDGEHEIAIVSQTGEARTTFTVETASTANDTESSSGNATGGSSVASGGSGTKASLVQTGDDMALPIATLVLASIVSMAAGTFALRKSRRL